VLPGRTPKPEDLLQIAKRPLHILVPFVLITVGAAIAVKFLPDRYRADTLIQVIPQQVPETYIRPTVTTRIDDRLRAIGQQIMSRTRLEPIAREFNLYAKEIKSGLMEDVIEQMRRDMSVDITRGDAFRISFVANDPRTAMRVTERIASMYIDASLRDREVLADGTNQFIESQMVAAKAQLVEDEKKLEQYKKRYTGQLPSQVQPNLQVIQNAQLQLQALTDSISREKDRQLMLESAINDLTSGPAATASAAAAAGGTTADDNGDDPTAPGVPASAALLPAAAQFEAASRHLEALQMRLKPEHPDVTRQKRIVAELQQKAELEAAAAEVAPAGAAPGGKPGAGRAMTPEKQAEVMRAERLVQLHASYDSLGRQIAQQERAQERLHGVIAEYQSRVEAAPTREAELTELTRDYETLQRTYTTLLLKKEDAQIAANLERNQIGEQFKILDPPRLPEKPISPNRPLFYALGALVGLAIGVALAVLGEYRDTTLKTDVDVVEAFALPVLALIPRLASTRELLHKRRRRRIASWVTAGTAAALISLIAWVLRS
jgi:polysaccharide chain length determinant protein (PEP-CTERM system associated)